MRPIPITELSPGQVLGTPIFNEKGELMLVSGFCMTEQVINSMKRRGIHSVYIAEDLATEMKNITQEKMSSEELGDEVSAAFEKSQQRLQNDLRLDGLKPDAISDRIEELAKSSPLLNVKAIQKRVMAIIAEIVDKNITMFAAYPSKSARKEEHKHAIDVTLLSLLIAHHFKYVTKDFRTLGTSALLHDIGKSALIDLLNRPLEDLSSEERAVEMQHPAFSMQILQESETFTFVEQITIHQHHEEADGSGYPQGLKSSGASPNPAQTYNKKYIHYNAEILAVANTYDNLLNGSLLGKRHTPEEALVKIINQQAGHWNEYVVKALVSTIQCYPRGACVRIVKTASERYDGYKGVVVKSNTNNPSKPTVCLTHNSLGNEIKPFIIDFGDEKEMELELH